MILPFFALVAVLALIPLLSPLALRMRLVDRPGGRKQHRGAVPLIGGLCIFPVFMILTMIGGGNISALWPFFTALALLLVIGAIDDRFQTGAWLRFAVHITAALLIVIPGHAQIYNLGNLFGAGDFDLGFMALPFSLAAAVLLVNAINLIDGLDGLAGGTGFVILFWLALAGGFSAMPELMVLMGALAGFLFYNMRSPWRKKAAVFLGDAGSLSLGLAIAWFSMTLATRADVALEPISVAWILALPIFDICAQFFRRVREGHHPFTPDRGHFHHHFIEAGVSPGRTTFIILLINFILGATGFLGARAGVPLVFLTVTWIALLLAHMAVSLKPRFYIGLFKKLA